MMMMMMLMTDDDDNVDGDDKNSKKTIGQILQTTILQPFMTSTLNNINKHMSHTNY